MLVGSLDGANRMSKQKFETYWIVDGIRVNSYHTMKKMVEAGKTGIEISATKQQIEADNRKQQARQNAIEDARIRETAMQREHENSPQGQREAALRTAAANPGGIVSGGIYPFAELEVFGPDKTNILR